MSTDREPIQAHALVETARAQLRDTREALSRLTGGAAPAVVLAELAQKLAEELAAHFDELPMRRFTGRVPRAAGVAGALLPHHRVPHRLVLGRYLSVGPWQFVGIGHIPYHQARIAILALGADGVLRSGRLTENVLAESADKLTLELLTWDSPYLRRVPSHTMRLTRWHAGAEPVHMARPTEVLPALAAIAASVAQSANRDLDLLQRFLDGDQR